MKSNKIESKKELNKEIKDSPKDVKDYFHHFIKNKNIYLFLLLIIILTSTVLVNYNLDKPLVYGEESYYHLSKAQEYKESQQNIRDKFSDYYSPYSFILSYIPKNLVFLLPIILAISTLFILLEITKKIGLSEKITFFYLLILIASPVFIFTFTTISAYSFFLFLSSLGFILLLQENKIIQYCSTIPLLFATFFDLYSSLILIIMLLAYYYYQNKSTKNKLVNNDNKNKENREISIAIIITSIMAIFNGIFLKVPLILGPFHNQRIFSDLISDLGGLSGLSFFTLLLFLVGFVTTWKKKNFHLSYLLLLVVVPAYWYNTQAIFHLSLIIIFFAAVGFSRLLNKKWNLKIIKKVTVQLLLLGLLFSTMTYINRIQDYGPTHNDVEVLTWIKDNNISPRFIFSIPGKSYYISYFAEKEPLYYPHERKETKNSKEELTEQILQSTYTQETFPLLDNNNIYLLYIPKEIRDNYPHDQGLLFLLKNQRFKIIYNSGKTELWSYEE